ncbi:MAG: IgGFc-binding protein [bacterium]
MRHLLLALLMVVLSCSDDTKTTQPVDMGGGDVAKEDVGPDAVSCEPGEIIACGEENTPSVTICAASGDRYEPSSCPSSPLQVCREGACVEVECLPGTRRCATDTQPEVCKADGSGFEFEAACTGSGRCEAGNCLNRCQVAELTNSYIGCEYWAVELENHLLAGETDNPLPDDLRPPFAVVLSNPSTTYDARVTVFEADGQIASAIVDRTVGTDNPLPGQDLVTVHSEVIGPNGRQLFKVDGPIDNVVLPRGSMMTLLLPYKEIPFGSTSITASAYRVTTNQPVVAYQFNPLCCNYNYTNDASLLLPTSALTNNYMFMSYAVFAGTPEARLAEPFASTLTVVATKPDTDVTVQLQPSKLSGRPYAEIVYPPSDARIMGPDLNGRIRVRLQPHEVLNVGGGGATPVEDLTGATVTSTKPVAVFGGHSCAFIPFSAPACDHLESQLFPVETWGTRFIAAPLKLRRDPDATGASTREGTYWKFVAYQDQTVVQTGVPLTVPSALPPADEGVPHCASFAADPASGSFTLGAGQTCEFGTTETFIAEAGKPIMVGAFLSGQNSVKVDAQFGDHAGDPAFFLVPPEEQFRTEYSFLTPATYFQSYVTVLIRPGFTVSLDGQTLDLTQYDYAVVEGRDVARAHIEVTDGPHRIEAQIPFGIVVYGYDDYVSYAYTGGLDLTKLNTF